MGLGGELLCSECTRAGGKRGVKIGKRPAALRDQQESGEHTAETQDQLLDGASVAERRAGDSFI